MNVIRELLGVGERLVIEASVWEDQERDASLTVNLRGIHENSVIADTCRRLGVTYTAGEVEPHTGEQRPFTFVGTKENLERLVDAIWTSKSQVEKLKLQIKEGQLAEVAPPGWEGTVKRMKKHKQVTNAWALAWYMRGKGARSHVKEARSAWEDQEEEVKFISSRFSAWQEGSAFDKFLKTHHIKVGPAPGDRLAIIEFSGARSSIVLFIKTFWPSDQARALMMDLK